MACENPGIVGRPAGLTLGYRTYQIRHILVPTNHIM